MGRIVLGTAQFGMDYGINNRRGRLSQKEASLILEKAVTCHIDMFDTAQGYGNAEDILGAFVEGHHDKTLSIISKLPSGSCGEVRTLLEASLDRLRVPCLYAYLIHDFNAYMDSPEIFNELQEFKEKGKVKKIGFSLYRPCELEAILENGLNFDIVQLPFSIFDQRFSPYLSKLKEKGIEIHARSIFLQGLLFKEVDRLDSYFSPIRHKIEELHALSDKVGISICALCFNFIAINRYVDKIIIGVDRLEHLEEIITTLDYMSKVRSVIDQLFPLREDNEEILLPTNWNSQVIKGLG